MNKVTLITGASSGIGLGLASALLDAGQQVLALQRRSSSSLLGRPGYREVLQDLSDFDAVGDSVARLLAGTDQLQRVILNAGIAAPLRDMSETSIAELKHLMDVNTWANKAVLDGVFSVGLPLGSVVGISSGAAAVGKRGWNGYALSKAAFAMLLQLYAAERPNTHFCSLAPGLVDTAMQEDLCGVDTATQDKFPSVKKLMAARGTEAMPTPEGVAKRLLAACEAALSKPSGSFLDLRTL